MKLRSGKTYTVASEKSEEILSPLLHKLLEHINVVEKTKGTMPRLRAQKDLFDFLNNHLDEIDPPQDIIRGIQTKSRKLIQQIEGLVNSSRTTQPDRDFLFSFLETISVFYNTAEDDYIEYYIQQNEHR